MIALRHSLSKIVLISILISLYSCSKSDDAPANNFTWTFKSNTYTTTIDKANTNSSGPYIIAAVTGTSFMSFNRRVDFSLTSFNVGAYNFGSSGGNIMQYIDETGLVFSPVSGSLDITSNSNNLLSGNFSLVLIDPSSVTYPISGSFANMTIEP